MGHLSLSDRPSGVPELVTAPPEGSTAPSPQMSLLIPPPRCEYRHPRNRVWRPSGPYDAPFDNFSLSTFENPGPSMK